MNHLHKIQNHAARTNTNSSYNAPGRPPFEGLGFEGLGFEGLGWKTIQELISYDSGTKVFKSLNGLALQYFSTVVSRI